MEISPIVTLTTDFGLQDGFVGILKGVIWSICPQARLADISHAVAAQDVRQGALLLRRAVPYFPPGTVHLAVVDPGVGTSRRGLAARMGAHFFVGPDNGLFGAVLADAEATRLPVAVVELTESRFWRAEVSATFHGRDVFAPVAAHLANGVPLTDLGPALKDPVRLALPQAERTATGWTAHVSAIDAFGNLASDLPAGELPPGGAVVVRCCGRQIHGLVRSYGEREAGELVALVDSQGRLEIAVVNGSAARELGARLGDPIEIFRKLV
jgi:S-adenosylmethionine hydrolase